MGSYDNTSNRIALAPAAEVAIAIIVTTPAVTIFGGIYSTSTLQVNLGVTKARHNESSRKCGHAVHIGVF